MGDKIGPFERVITSPIPRAIETAQIMGFEVDESLDELSEVPEISIPWDAGFARYAEFYYMDIVLKDWADSLKDLITRIAQTLTEKGSALIVSHGGVVEASAVGCMPQYDFRSWNFKVDYCEGVRLEFEGNQFVDVKFLGAKNT